MAENDRRRQPPSSKQKYDAVRRARKTHGAARQASQTEMERLTKEMLRGASDQYTQAEMAHDLSIWGAAQAVPPAADEVTEFEPYPAEPEKLGEISHTPVRTRGSSTNDHELQEGPVFDAIIIEDDDM